MTSSPLPQPALLSPNAAEAKPRRAFHLDKWYLDTLLPDGTVLLVYLGRLLLAGRALVRVTAELFCADGTRLAGSSAGGAYERGDGFLTCGSAELRGERLRFDTPGLSGELVFAARLPAFERLPLLTHGSRALHWRVEVPDADVTGELRWPGGGRALAGRGYCNRVTFDILPWQLPLRVLRWGRAVSRSHAVSWLAADVGPDSAPLRAGFADAEPCAEMPSALVLGTPRTLVVGPVVELGGLRLGALRPLLRLATRDPRQHKWAAPATLYGEPARAVHERVCFGQSGGDCGEG